MAAPALLSKHHVCPLHGVLREATCREMRGGFCGRFGLPMIFRLATSHRRSGGELCRSHKEPRAQPPVSVWPEAKYIGGLYRYLFSNVISCLLRFQSILPTGRIDEKSPAHHCVVNHLRLVGQISVKLDSQQLNDVLESVFAVGSADGLILKPYLS